MLNLELHPDSYEIVGMLWVQGETDSNTSNGSVAADTYHLNLEKFNQFSERSL